MRRVDGAGLAVKDFRHSRRRALDDAVDGWWWRRGVAAVQQEQLFNITLGARRM